MVDERIKAAVDASLAAMRGLLDEHLLHLQGRRSFATTSPPQRVLQAGPVVGARHLADGVGPGMAADDSDGDQSSSAALIDGQSDVDKSVSAETSQQGETPASLFTGAPAAVEGLFAALHAKSEFEADALMLDFVAANRLVRPHFQYVPDRLCNALARAVAATGVDRDSTSLVVDGKRKPEKALVQQMMFVRKIACLITCIPQEALPLVIAAACRSEYTWLLTAHEEGWAVANQLAEVLYLKDRSLAQTSKEHEKALKVARRRAAEQRAEPEVGKAKQSRRRGDGGTRSGGSGFRPQTSAHSGPNAASATRADARSG